MTQGIQRRRRWTGMWLAAAVLGAWLCSTFLPVPATAFAAAANRYNVLSCGRSSVTHTGVLTSTAGASIWLNYTSGPENTSLVISGAGWPGTAAITIDAYGADSYGQAVLGQASIVRATTRADGTFQTPSFLAPYYQSCGIGANYGEAGQFVLFRAHTSDNLVRAEVRFDYVDVFLNSPDAGTMGLMPGTVISVTVYTWVPDERVTMTTALLQPEPNNTDNSGAQSSGEPPLHITTNGRGNFTAQIQVPNDLAPPTIFLVGASGFDPGGYGTITASPLEFTILPTVAPTVTADLAVGYPGTQVTLRGAHWLPGSVLAEYCRGQTSGNPFGIDSPYSFPHLDCNPIVSEGLGFASVHVGSFSVKVTIPENARPGPITIQVRNDSGVLPAIYVLAVPFTVLATWQVIHPRLAKALRVGEVALPLLLLGVGGAVAVVLWQRRRRLRIRPAA